MWTCESCGVSGLDDAVSRCPGCGQPRFRELTLTGPAGSVVVRLDLAFGSRNLAELVGEDSRYAEAEQFRVFRRDGEWFLAAAVPPPRNPVAVNGAAVGGEPVRLANGDVVAITSAKDPSVRKGEITVGLG